MFSNWWETLQASKMTEGEENRLTLKSRNFRSMALKRCMWKHWTGWIQHWVKPLRKKLKYAKVYLESLLYRQVLSSWKFFVRLRKMKQLKMVQAYTHESGLFAGYDFRVAVCINTMFLSMRYLN